MTPKEKAEELYDKFNYVIPINTSIIDAKEVIASMKNDHDATKQCALIAVDEILKSLHNQIAQTDTIDVIFWKKVKQEIEKI